MDQSSSQNYLLFIIIPLFFAAIWCTVSYLVAFIGGWRLLAKRFRLQREFYGETWSMQSARMHFGTQYNSVLTIGADNNGLFLVPFVLFRLWHPALLVPWTQISIEQTTQWFLFKYVDVFLGQEESIPLRIRPKVAAKLQAAAGQAWPGFNRMELPPQAIE